MSGDRARLFSLPRSVSYSTMSVGNSEYDAYGVDVSVMTVLRALYLEWVCDDMGGIHYHG